MVTHTFYWHLFNVITFPNLGQNLGKIFQRETAGRSQLICFFLAKNQISPNLNYLNVNAQILIVLYYDWKGYKIPKNNTFQSCGIGFWFWRADGVIFCSGFWWPVRFFCPRLFRQQWCSVIGAIEQTATAVSRLPGPGVSWHALHAFMKFWISLLFVILFYCSCMFC